MVTVEQSQVNSFLWGKQYLAPNSAGSDVIQVVEDLVALHATSPTTPYLSLRARMAGFQPQDLDRPLYADRSLIKVLCMRQTVHVVSARDSGDIVTACGNRINKSMAHELDQLAEWSGEKDAGRLRQVVANWQSSVESYLAGHGPATAAEITAALPELEGKIHYAPDKPYGGMVSIGSMLFPRLTALGVLVRGRPRGTWRSNLHEYALASQWLRAPWEQGLPLETAQARLMQRYLQAFGPVTLTDAEWWTGWSKKETQRAFAAIEHEISQVCVRGVNQSLYLLARELTPLREARSLSSGTVRLLPCLDGYIMGYKERSRFLEPAHNDHVFDRSGNAYSTVWADGRVIGIWSEDKDTLTCYLWQDGWADTVRGEAVALAHFLRAADGRSTKAELSVRILPYPDGLYVKTPFTLALR